MNLHKLQLGGLCSVTLWTISLFSTFTVTNTVSAQTASPQSDPLLQAMQVELDREKALMLPGMQHPYFVEYRLDDLTSYEAIANYGALTREEENHQRIVRVTVRIGDYAVDSSTGRGDGSLELAPTDNNPEALRYALWTATDTAYKNALRAYTTKQAALNRILATNDKQDIFNGICGAESGSIPVSAVAPAMLVSEIETQRQAQGTARPPILPPPGATSNSTSGKVVQ